jgi:hypothetical protein
VSEVDVDVHLGHHNQVDDADPGNRIAYFDGKAPPKSVVILNRGKFNYQILLSLQIVGFVFCISLCQYASKGSVTQADIRADLRGWSDGQPQVDNHKQPLNSP